MLFSLTPFYYTQSLLWGNNIAVVSLIELRINNTLKLKTVFEMTFLSFLIKVFQKCNFGNLIGNKNVVSLEVHRTCYFGGFLSWESLLWVRKQLNHMILRFHSLLSSFRNVWFRLSETLLKRIRQYRNCKPIFLAIGASFWNFFDRDRIHAFLEKWLWNLVISEGLVWKQICVYRWLWIAPGF